MEAGDRSSEVAGEDPHRWLEREREVLVEAVGAAPSIHNTRPWDLVVGEQVVQLRSRRIAELDEHDPHGRDRRISCGAALTHLLLGMRHLGWFPRVRRTAEPDDGRVLAEVTATHRGEPTAAERRRFAAIDRRYSHRGLFAETPVPDEQRESVRTAGGLEAGETRWISGGAEALEVARTLEYAARVVHDDGEYQRELTRWTVETGSGPAGSDAGIPRGALGERGLPAVGLVTGSTRLADEALLAARIGRENVLVLCSRADGPADHLRVGEALAAIWLEATARGLAVSMMTQPLRLSEVRAMLAERLQLDGQPHLLMRFGYPK